MPVELTGSWVDEQPMWNLARRSRHSFHQWSEEPQPDKALRWIHGLWNRAGLSKKKETAVRIAKKDGSRWTAARRGSRKDRIDNFGTQIPQHYASFFVEPDLSKPASLQHEFSPRRPRLAKRGWICSVKQSTNRPQKNVRSESRGYFPVRVLWFRQEF